MGIVGFEVVYVGLYRGLEFSVRHLRLTVELILTCGYITDSGHSDTICCSILWSLE